MKIWRRGRTAAAGTVLVLAAASIAGGPGVARGAAAAPPQLVPKPVTLTTGTGEFALTSSSRIIAHTADSTPVANGLAANLRPATGYTLEVRDATAQSGDIELVQGLPPELGTDPTHEGYRLTVTSTGVRVVAPTAHGLFNGAQTIRQLLPTWAAGATKVLGPWTMPAVTVTDYPRYAYRGVMLDLGRHYQTPESVKKVIDLSAAQKLNTLHLHMSDDQGFRVAINGFPRLTSVGGAGSACKIQCPDPGGFWTQAQYRDVVAYAAARFMSVVPEVDTPGHNNAIIMSEYNDNANPLLSGDRANINCGSRKPPQWDYSFAVGYSAMCPESSNTKTIITAIVQQLSGMSSGTYYHLGGDEVPASLLSASRFASFVNWESGVVTGAGKKVMGWADGLATVAGTAPPAGSVGQAWQPGASDATAAVQKGMKVVMSPANRIYLDQTYPDQSGLGLGWACGRCDLDVNFNWEPSTLNSRVTDANIIGVEGPLWTETVVTLADAQYLLLPRLLAVAEIAWSPKEARTGRTSAAFQNFTARVAAQGARFTAAGYNFFTTTQVPWRLDIAAGTAQTAPNGQVSGTLAMLSAPGVTAGSMTATIAWGDGTASTRGTITGTPATSKQVNGVYTITGGHTFANGPGGHDVTVTIAAPGGRSAVVHLTL